MHEVLAPKLIGRDPRQIDRIAKDVGGYLGFRSAGAEMRGNSALDIALWDILGKITGQPIAQLLGGFTREKIRTYNTCAGSAYMRENAGQSTANWGLAKGAKNYDDLNGFLHRADELAIDLLEEGITAMKIWPFDPAAEASGGRRHLAPKELKAALAAVREDPQGGRRPNGDHGRIPFDVAIAARHADRQGADAVSDTNGTRTRSGWTASPVSSATPTPRPRRSAPPRRWRRVGRFATCWRPAPQAS